MKQNTTPSILFFLCLNDRGGAELSMIRLAQALADAGRKVTLAVYGRETGLARASEFVGEIIDLDCRRTVAALMPLYRLLRGGRFDLALSALTHTNIVAVIAGCLARRRVVVSEHGLDGVTVCAASPLFAALVRLIYRRAAAVIAVSEGLAERWRKILPDIPVNAIYNPVVVSADAEMPPPANPWLATHDRPVVIGMGRLKAEKNFALLLRAFAQLAAARDARLIILGEGAQRAALEALARECGIQDKVAMPGFIDDPRGFLAHADLFVCPSDREGFGNALVEALACGVPVVSTDCPDGPAEILDGGKYGMLVPVNDAAALARAMSEALRRDRDPEPLRNRARLFTVGRCVDAYAALIDSLRLRGS